MEEEHHHPPAPSSPPLLPASDFSSLSSLTIHEERLLSSYSSLISAFSLLSSPVSSCTSGVGGPLSLDSLSSSITEAYSTTKEASEVLNTLYCTVKEVKRALKKHIEDQPLHFLCDAHSRDSFAKNAYAEALRGRAWENK